MDSNLQLPVFYANINFLNFFQVSYFKCLIFYVVTVTVFVLLWMILELVILDLLVIFTMFTAVNDQKNNLNLIWNLLTKTPFVINIFLTKLSVF